MLPKDPYGASPIFFVGPVDDVAGSEGGSTVEERLGVHGSPLPDWKGTRRVIERRAGRASGGARGQGEGGVRILSVVRTGVSGVVLYLGVMERSMEGVRVGEGLATGLEVVVGRVLYVSLRGQAVVAVVVVTRSWPEMVH